MTYMSLNMSFDFNKNKHFDHIGDYGARSIMKLLTSQLQRVIIYDSQYQE